MIRLPVSVVQIRIRRLKHVVSFYQFTRIDEPESVKTKLESALFAQDVVGTLLLATEGVNATLSHAKRETLERIVSEVEAAIGYRPLETKYSTAREDNPVFFRLKIKVRDEIIQFGHSLTGSDRVGTRVSAKQWNQLLDDPNVTVVDMRNDYEIAVGTFQHAEAIGLERFGDCNVPLDELLERTQGNAIAMFCTGGVRCEKASYALLEKGCETVYQLDGGILGYLDSVDPAESKWEGECFVFDQRVTVDAELNQGSFDQCHACRHPIDAQDMKSPHYVKSVSCPNCIDSTTARQKAQFAERAKQEELARKRGSRHVGVRQSQLA